MVGDPTVQNEHRAHSFPSVSSFHKFQRTLGSPPAPKSGTPQHAHIWVFLNQGAIAVWVCLGRVWERTTSVVTQGRVHTVRNIELAEDICAWSGTVTPFLTLCSLLQVVA